MITFDTETLIKFICVLLGMLTGGFLSIYNWLKKEKLSDKQELESFYKVRLDEHEQELAKLKISIGELNKQITDIYNQQKIAKGYFQQGLIEASKIQNVKLIDALSTGISFLP